MLVTHLFHEYRGTNRFVPQPFIWLVLEKCVFSELTWKVWYLGLPNNFLSSSLSRVGVSNVVLSLRNWSEEGVKIFNSSFCSAFISEMVTPFFTISWLKINIFLMPVTKMGGGFFSLELTALSVRFELPLLELSIGSEVLLVGSGGLRNLLIPNFVEKSLIFTFKVTVFFLELIKFFRKFV